MTILDLLNDFCHLERFPYLDDCTYITSYEERWLAIDFQLANSVKSSLSNTNDINHRKTRQPSLTTIRPIASFGSELVIT